MVPAGQRPAGAGRDAADILAIDARGGDTGAGDERRNPPVTVTGTCPGSPAEIIEVALAGIESGTSIVHNHNDEPMFTADGVHVGEPYLAAWRPVLERHPDALLYPTMAAGARGIPVARRWAHVAELARRGMGGMTPVAPGVGAVLDVGPRVRDAQHEMLVHDDLPVADRVPRHLAAGMVNTPAISCPGMHE